MIALRSKGLDPLRTGEGYYVEQDQPNRVNADEMIDSSLGGMYSDSNMERKDAYAYAGSDGYG